MAPFRFRLARLLDWYGRQAHLEESRLAACNLELLQTNQALVGHRESRRSLESELINSHAIAASDFAALSAWRRQANQQEQRLTQNCCTIEAKLERQRLVTQAVHLRVRLVERLRDRRRSEYDSELNRQLEALSAEAFLSGFARSLTSNTR